MVNKINRHKFAFVIQRFGKDIIGGAESMAYDIAKNLALQGVEIDVYTTQAIDYTTWENEIERESNNLKNLQVLRFPVKHKRNRFIFSLYKLISQPLLKRNKLAKHPIFKQIYKATESLWFRLQGPYCPLILEALKKNGGQYERIFFFTYLYFPTIYGLDIFPEKSTLVPSAHDEPPLYFARTIKSLNRANFFYTNTREEQKILAPLIANFALKNQTVGVGIERAKQAQESVFSNSQPYCLYMGRINKSKGIDFLIDEFTNFKRDNRHIRLSLYLCGVIESDIDLPICDDITYHGVLDRSQKEDLLYHAQFVIIPSKLESLSILALEAIASKKHLIVNSKCSVLHSYSQVFPTVLSYKNSEDFNNCLTKVIRSLESKQDNQNLTQASEQILARHSWDKVLSMYKNPPTYKAK